MNRVFACASSARIALGASRPNVVGLVLGHAARITLGGLIAGLALATMLGRSLTALIYPVAPFDPVTFAIVPVIAALTAAAACIAPAWPCHSRRSGNGVQGGVMATERPAAEGMPLFVPQNNQRIDATRSV